LIGLLDQDSKELALDFETGLMDVRLDLVGRCSSCWGMGKDSSSNNSSENA